MGSPHVYDKAKYHQETVDEFGLPEEHAANHTVVFLRWLIERDLTSRSFNRQCDNVLRRYRAGTATIHDVYGWWDHCLVDDMLSDEGNAFARDYFDFARGLYLADYAETLQRGLPSEYHVPYTEDNERLMREVIDRRFAEWKGQITGRG